MLDSLLYTLADESVPDAACATFATASEGDGVIVRGKCAKEKYEKTAQGRRGNLQRRAIGWASSEKLELQIRYSKPPKKSFGKRQSVDKKCDTLHGPLATQNQAKIVARLKVSNFAALLYYYDIIFTSIFHACYTCAI